MDRRYTLVQLEYFVAVAEHGSMTSAAQRLNVTQAAISLAVAALERELGLRLFHRNAKGLSLTARGRDLLPEARRLIGVAAEFDRAVVANDRSVEGTVRVGCFSPLAPFILPASIDLLTQAHPTLEVRFEEGSLLSLQDSLLNGAIEVALSYDHELQPGIQASPILTSKRMRVLLPQAHPLLAKDAVTVGDLAGERLIVMRVQPTHLYLDRLLADAGLADQVAHTSSSYELACALVGRGLGCALVGYATSSPVSVEGLPIASRALAEDALAASIVVLSAAGTEPSLKARLFTDAARSAAKALRDAF